MKNRFFYFYSSFYELVKELSPWKTKKLIKALCEYVETKREIKLDKTTQKVFDVIKGTIDLRQKMNENNGKKGANTRYS